MTSYCPVKADHGDIVFCTHISLVEMAEPNYISFVFCLSVTGNMRALYASVLLCSLLLCCPPPSGMLAAKTRHQQKSVMTSVVWDTLAPPNMSCLLRQERRRVRGRREAYPTGACGRQTFSDGWKNFEPRRLKVGCRTWLAPSGLTFPSAVSWVTKAPRPTLHLRSDVREALRAEKYKKKGQVEATCNDCLKPLIDWWLYFST